TAAGRNATPRFRTVARACGERGRSAARPRRRDRYSHTTASTAPSWMKTSKTSARFPVMPNQVVARIKCPVDDTGRNSVSPSMIPSTKAMKSTLRLGGRLRHERRHEQERRQETRDRAHERHEAETSHGGVASESERAEARDIREGGHDDGL